MKSKKKIRKYSVFFCAVILCVFCVPFNAFAYYGGTWSDSVSFATYYDLLSGNPLPLYNSQYASQLYLNQEDLTSDGLLFPVFNSDNTYFNSFNSSWETVQNYSGNVIYNDLSFTSDNVSYDISIAKKCISGNTDNNGSIRYLHTYYLFHSDGSSNEDIVLIGNYAVSSSPFVCYWTELYPIDSSEPFHYNDFSTSSLYDNGLYMLDMNGPIYYGSQALLFTDMNIYSSSISGGSGFTSFSTTSTDFSFNDISSYYNFNYLKTGGEFIDPNAPLTPDPEPDNFANDKYHLNFVNNTYYGGDGVSAFYHTNNFSFNEYMLLNPSNYKIHFNYVVTAKTETGSAVQFEYSPDDIQLAYFLGQSRRNNGRSVLIVNLNSDWFTDEFNHSLTSYLKGVVHAVDGTNTSTASPDTIFGTSPVVDIDPLFGFVTNENTQKYLPHVLNRFVGSSQIPDGLSTFQIKGYVSIYTANDSNYESYEYEDFYNFLTREGTVTSTDNVNPPYTEEGQTPSVVTPESPSSGGNNYASGSVNPTINVTVNSGGNNVPWTPFTLDQVSYANVKTMFNDIKDFVDSTSENSFWAVLQKTFGYIPQQIWNYIIISVAVICGFSVVRYVLRR